MKKIFTVAILILFINVMIVSNINIHLVKASDDNSLVEVTTQVYGIKGYKNTAVKLSMEQYNELEQYFVEFKARVNQTITREEAVPIFKEAVVELSTYGLLPRGMSIKQAQQLVNGYDQVYELMNVFRTMYRKNQIFNDSNFLCLISGETTGTNIIGPVELGVSALLYVVLFLYILADIIFDDPVVLEESIARLRETCTLIQKITSARIIQIGSIIFGISIDAYLPPEFRFFPASGWIETQGLLGKKSWNGTFFGSVRNLHNFECRQCTYYFGAIGFIGLKVSKGDGKIFFLGSAFHVDVDYFEL